MSIKAVRYHDISCGHRVVGHEGKCRNLHGHNYRITFTCEAVPGAHELDDVGRVIDFSVIKEKLCAWLEYTWDHRMLLWKEDEQAEELLNIDGTVVITSFNPTAENIGTYLLNVIGPMVLPPEVRLIEVQVEETRKCSAIAKL